MLAEKFRSILQGIAPKEFLETLGGDIITPEAGAAIISGLSPEAQLRLVERLYAVRCFCDELESLCKSGLSPEAQSKLAERLCAERCFCDELEGLGKSGLSPEAQSKLAEHLYAERCFCNALEDLGK